VPAALVEEVDGAAGVGLRVGVAVLQGPHERAGGDREGPETVSAMAPASSASTIAAASSRRSRSTRSSAATAANAAMVTSARSAWTWARPVPAWADPVATEPKV
jgi:hypothetical protein